MNINEILISSSEKFRGHIEFEEFQNSVMDILFYKYLSYNIEKENNKKLFKYDITFQEAFNEENYEFYGKIIKEENMKILGYFIEPVDLYQNILKSNNVIDDFNKAVKNIKFENEELKKLFTFINSKNNDELKEAYENLIQEVNLIKFKNENIDELMKYFLKNSFTPIEISKLLCMIVSSTKKDFKNIYDATCGSASTLLMLKKVANVNNYFGQEIKKNSFRLSQMNMIMHGIPPKNFQIFNEDSTTSQRELPPMDAIVSHPPFLKKWDANKNLINDKRFNSYKKLPPKSKASYAFIETMIYHLNENGIMAVVMPQTILSRSNAEKEIRKTLVKEKNYVDAIIGLPEKTFPKNISACIIIFKKNRNKEDNILFIDASQEFEKTNNLHKLTEENISKIVNIYKNKSEINRYSHNASISEIKENDYNLNIKRYVNTYVEKDKINIKETINEIDSLEKDILLLKEKEKELLKKLGFSN